MNEQQNYSTPPNESAVRPQSSQRSLMFIIFVAIVCVAAGATGGYFFANSGGVEKLTEDAEAKMSLEDWEAQQPESWGGKVILKHRTTGEEKVLFADVNEQLLTRLPADTFKPFGREVFGAHITGSPMTGEKIYFHVGPAAGVVPSLYSYNINTDELVQLMTLPHFYDIGSPNGDKSISWTSNNAVPFPNILQLGCYSSDSIRRIFIGDYNGGQYGGGEILLATPPEFGTSPELEWIDNNTIKFNVYTLPATEHAAFEADSNAYYVKYAEWGATHLDEPYFAFKKEVKLSDLICN